MPAKPFDISRPLAISAKPTASTFWMAGQKPDYTKPSPFAQKIMLKDLLRNGFNPRVIKFYPRGGTTQS